MAKIDKQAYLLSYFDDISNSVKDLKYEYVYCLNTNDYSFPTTLANLTNRSELEPFVKLKTHQYNSLIPKIRLYRIDYDNQKDIIAQKQFVFKKDYKYDVVSMTKPIVRDNCGIKSINWKLAGSNPVSAEKQVEVEIQMYFDSINAFSGGSYDSMISAWTNINKNEIEPFKQNSFKFCESETTTTNYWSLLFHPQTEKSKYDTFRFRIKAEVGWEDIGENIRSQLGISSDTVDIIKKLNYTFFLNLVKHQFTLNEDGSLQVTANYIASFESTTHNQQFDILGDLKKAIDEFKNKTISQLSGVGNTLETQREIEAVGFFGYSEIESALIAQGISTTGGGEATDASRNVIFGVNGSTAQQISALANLTNTLNDRSKLEKLQGCKNALPEPIKSLVNSDNETIEKQAKAFNAINEAVSNYIDRASQIKIKEYYSSFMEKIISGDNFFAINVTQDQAKQWSSWYIGGNEGNKPIINFDITSDSLSTSVKDAISTIKQELNTAIENIDNENAYKDTLKENVETEIDPNGISIVFTTFGSIINTAFSLVEDNIAPNDTIIKELKRLKIVLSNISDENQIFNYNSGNQPFPNETTGIKNLAFIPIEINILKSFLIENIVRPKKTSYTLYSFLKDALSTLVIAGVNSFGQKNNETDKYANISLGSALISLGNNSINPSDDPLSEFKRNKDSSIILGVDLNSSNLNQFYVDPINVHKQYFTYFLMYDKTLKDFKPKKDPIEDAEQNVYHYTYGQDYGLIKAINFTKIDQPYLKEAKAVGRKTFFLGQFRDVYNADLTMIGNNIYYPGMMLYIRPSVETSIGGNIPSFSQVTGIGGYYFVTQVESSITEDGYETKLKTIWHSDGYEASADSLDLEQQCAAFLQDLGLDSKSITSSVKSLILGINTQISGNVAAENEEEAQKKAELARRAESFESYPIPD